jgi:hypothetical protein
MKTVLLSVGCMFVGLMLSITPIPFLPKIWWQGIEHFKERYDSALSGVTFAVLNLLWALVPFAFIGGVYTSSGLIPAIFFCLGMYGPFLFFSLRGDTNSRPAGG